MNKKKERKKETNDCPLIMVSKSRMNQVLNRNQRDWIINYHYGGSDDLNDGRQGKIVWQNKE